MPSKKKTGVAYMICGIVFIVLTLLLGVVGWKMIAGIILGAFLVIIGLILSKKG
jgi:hypothetical protein